MADQKLLKTIYVITGQTATGKTARAVSLAKEVGGELISADSRQAYQKLDIITGKDLEDRNFVCEKVMDGKFKVGYYLINGVRVWLYDILDVKEVLTAYDWARLAWGVIVSIAERGKTPIIVGGTYFYIKTLLEGAVGNQSSDWVLREKLEKETLLELQDKLFELDETRFHNLNASDMQNKRRLIRWIEKLTPHKETQKSEPVKPLREDFEIQIQGLKCENPTILEARVKKRVQERLRLGALDEVKLLLQMGYKPTDFGLQTIGYKELLSYVLGDIKFEDAVTVWVKKEKQYAKRQLTLMKREESIKWETIS
jgi:tRNA dimethylallyltransferase